METPIALSQSPIQSLGGGMAPGMASGIPPGPVQPQGPVSTQPIGLSGTPPGGAEDAMGTPDGAIVGTHQEAAPNFLVSMVNGHFATARMAKQEQERVWEKCHDNYRGTAPRPVNEMAMKLRSKVTMKITRTKVASAVARLKEIGFKWGIKPTPEPNVIDFTPVQLRTALTDILASMQDKSLAAEIQAEMNVDEMMQQVKDLARSRSEAMKTRIADDFVEMRFDAMYDQGLLDMGLYGTMIFKGPLTKEKRPGRWIRKGGAWGFLDVDPDVKLYRPEVENVSPWDFYPSPGAWMVEKLEWAIVRNVMGHREVADLVDNPGFNADEIWAVLADRTGAWTAEPWESRMFASNGESTALGMGMPDKFVVLDWWGYIKVSDLRRAGGNIAKVKVWSNLTLKWEEKEPDENEVVIANIWVCGNHVLRAWSASLKPRRLPFFVVPYERIPKSLWGQGVAWMMEDWVAVMNTVYRAMIDNMAISALPIGWYDKSRMTNSTEKGDLFPGKMFEVKDTERSAIPPVQFHFPPNNVAHMRMIAEIARANIQESTSLPDLVQGLQTGATHNRTAAGMSMLGGWADVSTRSVQKNIDQEATRPLVRAIYFWEMQFSNDDRIKGDFDVEALGVDSVMADEVLTQRVMQWIQAMQQNPASAKRINWSRVGDVSLRTMGIKDEGLTYTEAQVRENDKADAEAAMQMQAQANSNPALQPQMAKKDFLLKCLDSLPENSQIAPPLLRAVLNEAGEMTPEIETAINAEMRANAELNAGKLTETDKANLELANAIQSKGPNGSQPSAAGGSGNNAGAQTPV